MNDRFALTAGSIVSVGGEGYEILGPARDQEFALLCRPLNGSRNALPIPIAELSAPIAAAPTEQLSLLDLAPGELQRARERLEIISPLLGRVPTRAFKERAKLFGLSTPSLYRWRQRYKASGERLESLVRLPNPGKTGKRGIDPRTEAVIRDVIQSYYLTPARHSVVSTCDEIVLKCRREDIPVPSENTIRKRIAEVDPAEAAYLRGEKKRAKALYAARPGKFGEPDCPLSVLEMDGTPLDVIVVSESTGEPLGPPYLVIAIDDYSRMITGFSLSLEGEGRHTAGSCLAMSMCRKESYLEELGVDAQWPIWGIPRTLYTDNGDAFVNEMLKRVSKKYGFTLSRRPVGRAHFGGRVERAIGTISRAVHDLPGTKFSNVAQKADHDAEGQSAMTMRALEVWMARFIAAEYNVRFHSGIQTSPMERYLDAVKGRNGMRVHGFPEVPRDEYTLRIDLLPFETRAIGREGVQINNMHYFDPVLRSYIGRGGTYPFHWDPGNVSKIYFFDELTNRYHEIATANLGRPAVTHGEMKLARALLRQRRQKITEHAIYHAIAENRALVEAEIANTAVKRKNRRIEEQRRVAQPQLTRRRAPERPSPEIVAEAIDTFDPLPAL